MFSIRAIPGQGTGNRRAIRAATGKSSEAGGPRSVRIDVAFATAKRLIAADFLQRDQDTYRLAAALRPPASVDVAQVQHRFPIRASDIAESSAIFHHRVG